MALVKLNWKGSYVKDSISESRFCVQIYIDQKQTLGKKCIGCCGTLSPLDICPLACITSGKKNIMKY